MVTWVCVFVLQINAMANKAAGKGYESEGSYEKMDLKFIGIQNIHVMRDSLQKLTDGNNRRRKKIIIKKYI